MHYSNLIYQVLWIAFSITTGIAKSPCGEGEVGIGSFTSYSMKDGYPVPGARPKQYAVVFSSTCSILSLTSFGETCDIGWDQDVTVDCDNGFKPTSVTTKDGRYDVCYENTSADIGEACNVKTPTTMLSTWVQTCCKKSTNPVQSGRPSGDTLNPALSPVGEDDNQIDYMIHRRRRK